MGRTWGYARVSDEGQSLDLQLDALRSAGIPSEMIFTDRTSGANHCRQVLNDLLRIVSPGDHLVVWRLDRLGRFVAHLASVLDTLNEQGVTYQRLTESTDNRDARLALPYRLLVVESGTAGLRSKMANSRRSFSQRAKAGRWLAIIQAAR